VCEVGFSHALFSFSREKIMDDNRIERLINGVRMSEHHDTFEVPSKAEIASVKLGSTVKIGLEWDGIDPSGERFWVLVLARKDEHFCGLVVNELEFVESVEMLSLVGFDAQHILGISTSTRPPMKLLEECADRMMVAMT
jgi:hypothetical protein